MGLERDFQEAGLGLLRASADLTVYPDAQGFVVEHPALPYVRAYTSVSWPSGGEANSMDGLSVTAVARWYVKCVSETQTGCLELAALVRGQLLDQRPTITGRVNGLIKFEGDSGEQPERSELGGSPLYEQTVVYVMMSAPG